ncbi:hypothetical protein [Sorangium sp. So ce385]|uniref:hypothetical protein n=1 Tax=Sorangium sp. So ce385 TaxID=3133308 RepID=UPI003F5C2AF5
MSRHLVRRPVWGNIDLDTETGRIFVQERWQYTWTVVAPARPWTLRHRQAFHRALDRQVWRTWSGHIRLHVAGSHAFARRFARGLPPASFDVRWVLAQPHWNVTVRKLPPGSDPTTFISYVDFPACEIHLDSADTAPYSPTNAAGQTRTFYALPHEFGHTMPQSPGVPNQDEYGAGSPHLGDTDSLLNIGRQVRARHLTALITELNDMLPGCTFSA